MKADQILSPQSCKHQILQEFHMDAPLSLAWSVKVLIISTWATGKETKSVLLVLKPNKLKTERMQSLTRKVGILLPEENHEFFFTYKWMLSIQKKNKK